MVLGMSGRNGEHRRGNTQPRKERDRERDKDRTDSSQPTLPSQKHKPSAEQVHIARLLGDDKTPSDMHDRVFQVKSIVIDIPEENIIIALHDNEYDVEKACESLLDSSGSSKDEWTTMAATKKNKKRTDTPPLKGRGGGSGSGRGRVIITSRGGDSGGNQHTRQSYREGGLGRTTDDGDKEKRSRGRGGVSGHGRQGRFSERGDGGRKWSDKESKGRRYGDNNRGRRPQRSFQPHNIEVSWDSKGEDRKVTMTTENTDILMSQSQGEENWESNDRINTPSESWIMVEHPVTHGLTGIFPDAIPSLNTGEMSSPPPNQDETIISDSSSPLEDVVPPHRTGMRGKGRRYKASQIPLQPVEMPSGIDALTLDLSMFGIDFGSETTVSASPFTPPGTGIPLVESSEKPHIMSPSHSHPPTSHYEDTSSHTQPQSSSTSLMSTTSPYTSQLKEDPVIIHSSSFKDTPRNNLEPPPGLTHPSQQTEKSKQGLLPPPEPISLPPPQSKSGNDLGLLTSISGNQLSLPHQTEPSTSSFSIVSLQGSHTHPPVSLETSSNHSFSQGSHTHPKETSSNHSFSQGSHTHPKETSSNHSFSQGSHTHPKDTSVSHSFTVPSSSMPTPTSSQPLYSNQPVTMVTPHVVPSSVTSSNNITPSSLHGNGVSKTTHVTGQNKVHGGVHPMAAGMVYSHMLPQFSAYGTAPAMMIPPYPYDVDSMNRYQGYYGQHATSQEQGLISGGMDHNTTPYTTDAKYDNVSGTTNPSQQQQQQQGALPQHNQMNAYYGHYPNVLYTMYPHLSMAAATAGYSQPMGHKPGTGTTYPVSATSYQPNPQGQYGLPYDEEYTTKLYQSAAALGKSNAVPSTTTGTEFAGYSKHQYDTKGGAYSNYLPTIGGPMGGYMMNPHVPQIAPMMTTHHENTSRAKHGKYPNVPTVWNPSTRT